jgi:hypothetical protein
MKKAPAKGKGAKPESVADYVASQPPERRSVLSKLRALIRKHLPKGYEEALNWGAITYQVPLKRCPVTYNGQPLCYVALAAQKNYFSLYLMNTYGDRVKKAQLENAFKAVGKKLDMGKACVRFRSLDDLPLDAIADIIASTPVDAYVAVYHESRKDRSRRA